MLANMSVIGIYSQRFSAWLLDVKKSILTARPGTPLGPSFPVSPGGPLGPGGPGGPGGPERQERGHSHYLNEPPLYELLVSGKKAMIDLREDHLSRTRNYHLRGVRSPQWARRPRKNGNSSSSSVKALSSSPLRLLLKDESKVDKSLTSDLLNVSRSREPIHQTELISSLQNLGQRGWQQPLEHELPATWIQSSHPGALASLGAQANNYRFYNLFFTGKQFSQFSHSYTI
ncbi:hypothetical protein EYF80_005810 [Liparis tanakae]|uniref:Uncharacterized protein n=1 Tax=Liparis tanakae TaxID=230148 RepID=A0A4Z2J149_9TELE|nr:hypothetical protein EYF80_005810 [Liparis tanakae]